MGLWFALILSILLSAFFSATETAFSASNRVRLKTVEGPRKQRAQLALKLLEKYDSLLTTVLIGNNVVNIAGTSIATVLFVTRIMRGSTEGVAATTASAVMTVLVLTRILFTHQFTEYSLVSGIAFFFIVEWVVKTPDNESGLRFKTFFDDLKKCGSLLWLIIPIISSLVSIIIGCSGWLLVWWCLCLFRSQGPCSS